MKVCITEKPSVARDIAQILGARDKHDGYFEGGDWRVTWTFGHLCTLKEPADYTDYWRRWSLGALPMIPERFGIKLIDDGGIRRQFQVIESLISEADEVINCGDAGQEGELIQRWVMQKAGIKCPVRRLWISSLTDEAIREGFGNLRPEDDFNNLYYAGLSRAVGDWILGMNATRLYTLKYAQPGTILSIGRVQTPTLALIVGRQKEIADFKPEDFWEIKTLYREAVFNATAGRFKTLEEAEKAMEEVRANDLAITDIQEKKGREAPPRLFDLTSLQVEANKRWGWSAEQTLKLIQSLYEKKVTTYPRVDTTYLPDDLYPKIPEILRKMAPYSKLTEPVVSSGKIPKSKKIFDNAKVTDHHAIIPTGQAPDTLTGDERPLYHMIALRFISAFYPDCSYMATTVNALAGKTGFKATGKTITDPGWRKVYEGPGATSRAAAAPDDRQQEVEEEGNRILPRFTVGESGPHSPSLLKRQTQPPKLYTEGTLLRAMESAGKTVDDEELREAMKENGIGRPSTRAAIIETLFKRGYIRRERKNIVATQAGTDLIEFINEELLKSAKLTGLWENKLRRIERGDYSAAEFISELKVLIGEIVLNVLRDNSSRRILAEQGDFPETAGKNGQKKEKSGKTPSANNVPKAPRAPRIKSIEEIACPLCGDGHLMKGRTAYGCSRFREGCGFLLPFAEAAADLTPGKLNQKIKSISKKKKK